MNYGISNAAGQCPPATAAAILAYARANRVELLDTASGYGDAESVLGDLLQKEDDFRIVTKTVRLRAGEGSEAVRAALRESLRRLRRERVFGVLVHSAADLAGEAGDSLWGALEDTRAAGVCEKIGISLYADADIDALSERFRPDFVQVPLNVFDQRLVQSGQLARLRRRGIDVHVRSVLLQGLLVMDPLHIPQGLVGAPAAVARFRAAASAAGLSPLAAAVAFVRSVPEVSAVVVGTTSVGELAEVVSAFRLPAAGLGWRQFAQADEVLIDPRKWPKR